MGRMTAAVRDKGTRALAWVSFVFAIVAGVALATTIVGAFITGIFKFLPWHWLATLTFVGAVVAMAIDLFVDGEPNQVALASMVAIPSLARAVPGRLGANVSHLATQVHNSLDQGLNAWLGTSSPLVLGLCCAAIAALIARRVVRKTAGG